MKRDAWFAQRGLSRTEAKRRYISTLIETMHRYASQTPEARELVEELEFVWDQIKANTSSSSASAASSSSPLRNSVGVPPLQYPQMQVPPQPQPRQQSLLQQRGYGSIGGRMAQPAYEDMVAIANANNHNHHHHNGRGESSRLRVLSPISQPDGMYQRRGSGMRDYEYDAEENNPEDDEEEDEEEQYEEAQDTFDEDDDDHDHDQYKNTTSNDGHHNQEDANSEASSLQQHHSNNTASSQSISQNPSKPKPTKPTQPTDTRRWRRRVEQALTKMTAEIAAVREQMETRAIAHRRRTSTWAWVKWLAWVTVRQVLWDLAVLAMLLIWMRIKGDRRVEERLRDGWMVLRGRLGRLRVKQFRV